VARRTRLPPDQQPGCTTASGDAGTVEEIKAAAAAEGPAVQGGGTGQPVPLVVGATRTCGGSYGCWAGGRRGRRMGARWSDAARCPSIPRRSWRPFWTRSGRRGTGPGCQPVLLALVGCQAGEPLPADVKIGDWTRPWNLKGERSIMGAPPSALWATDPAGFGQVGCVYTAQGFEYDWSGVDHRARPRLAGERLGRRPGCFERTPPCGRGTAKTAASDIDVDRFDPQYIQGALDARHGRHGHLLDRSRDSGEAAMSWWSLEDRLPRLSARDSAAGSTAAAATTG